MLWGRLFLEGCFPSTNEGYALIRSETAYRAKARRSPPPSAGMSFSRWAKAVRERVCLVARKGLRPVPFGCPVDVAFYLLRHERFDPDAWTCCGKWALDGICDAKIITSDRRDVNLVSGRCMSTAEQSDHFALGRGLPPRKRGLVIELDEVRL